MSKYFELLYSAIDIIAGKCYGSYFQHFCCGNIQNGFAIFSFMFHLKLSSYDSMRNHSCKIIDNS